MSLEQSRRSEEWLLLVSMIRKGFRQELKEGREGRVGQGLEGKEGEGLSRKGKGKWPEQRPLPLISS